MGERFRVLICVTSDGIGNALCEALEQRDFVCEAVSDARSVERKHAWRPDVALVDVDFGLATVARLVAHRDTRVIVLGNADPGDELWAAMRSGACGYLPRDLAPAAVCASILGVLAGEAAVPRVLMRRLIADLRKVAPLHAEMHTEHPTRSGVLTDRERDVLELLLEGRTTAEIGERLYIAKVTVRSHVAAIVRKMGCDDRAAAVEAARGMTGATQVECAVS
jgi:two-component system nitrate/nitrite response regulator NarL